MTRRHSNRSSSCTIPKTALSIYKPAQPTGKFFKCLIADVVVVVFVVVGEGGENGLTSSP